MLLTTAGLIVRCFINYNFVYVIIGQVILCMGQPFIFNASALLSATWFPKKERYISTSIAANSGIVGLSFGTFISSLFFTNADATNVVASQKSALAMCMAILAGSIIILILTYFFFDERRLIKDVPVPQPPRDLDEVPLLQGPDHDPNATSASTKIDT